MKIGVSGSTGRMGRAVIDVLKKRSIDFYSCSRAEGSIDEMLECCDVIIDFSSPDFFISLASKSTKPIVSGTTGFSEEDFRCIEKAAKNTAIFYSPNMSIGVNIMSNILKQYSNILKKSGFDVAILDIHHKYKKDSPSGTAKLLKESSGCDNISSLRVGEMIGKHNVIFSKSKEVIEISHIASDRSVFADSAVDYALWFAKKTAGFIYTAEDYFKDVR